MKLGLDLDLDVHPQPPRAASPRHLPSKRSITVESTKRSRLVFLTDPEGLAVEQYRLLCRRLCSLHPDGGVILVSSPGPGEGKTLTSINLSWCLADSGHKTSLVDLDFRAPGVAPVLGFVEEEEGTEDVLSGRCTVMEAAREVDGLPLHVLGVRHRVSSPARYLRTSALEQLTKDLRALFHWVVLDLAPAIPMADVAEIAPHVDGALLVVRSGKTEKALITPTVEMLGTKLWGVILNDTPINGSSYYGYYGNRADRQR